MARKSKLTSCELKVAHGDAHIYALEICEVQQPEEKTPFTITFGSLKEEVQCLSDSDDSSRLFV